MFRGNCMDSPVLVSRLMRLPWHGAWSSLTFLILLTASVSSMSTPSCTTETLYHPRNVGHPLSVTIALEMFFSVTSRLREVGVMPSCFSEMAKVNRGAGLSTVWALNAAVCVANSNATRCNNGLFIFDSPLLRLPVRIRTCRPRHWWKFLSILASRGLEGRYRCCG